jgi:hypothetical protein
MGVPLKGRPEAGIGRVGIATQPDQECSSMLQVYITRGYHRTGTSWPPQLVWLEPVGGMIVRGALGLSSLVQAFMLTPVCKALQI